MSIHAFVTEEDREESIIERRDRERSENGKVDNEESLPLFPNIKADARRVVQHIEVWKQDPPNNGFRGTIPTSSDYATVAKLYGNGMYELRAVTQDGKVLRRQNNVSIAYTAPEEDKPAYVPAHNTPDMTLLRWQADQHAADSRRIEDFGRMSVESTRSMAESQLAAQARQHELNMQRDREYHQAQLQQQQQFFQQMMAQVQTFHQQSMERAASQNNLIIEVMQNSHERISAQSDPRALLSVFQQGMMLSAGQQDEDEDETPDGEPWVRAIEAGAGAVKDIVEISRNKIAVPAAQPAQTQQTAPTQQKPASTKTAKPKSKAKSLFTKNELSTVIRAKRIMQQRGLDFEATVNNALMYLVQGAGIDSGEPNTEQEPESEDIEESPEGDIDESSETEVEGS